LVDRAEVQQTGLGKSCADCQHALWDGESKESRTGRCLSGMGTACRVSEGGLISLDVPYRAGLTCDAWEQRAKEV
jgi:hypothetical protein